MKAVIVTIPRDLVPMHMSNHWHIVDMNVSRVLVDSIRNSYRHAEIQEREWQWQQSDTPMCPECGERLDIYVRDQ